MILLDTHMWIWWVNNSPEISTQQKSTIQNHISEGIGVSLISCWEVAKKVEIGKLILNRNINEWLELSLSYPGVTPIDLSLEIIVESTKLPGSFHKDPADQLIVATSRVLDIPLLTADSKILRYSHVRLI